MRRLHLLLPALTVPGLLTLAGCAGPASDASSATSMGHIHDLAFDRNDLLVGTHTGIYRIDLDTDAVDLVGDVAFDAMGLTVQGGTIYASGHPSPDTGSTFAGPNIGLVRHTDTDGWEQVALAGSTDFHALATTPADPGLIVGLSTERPALSVTTDSGETWGDAGHLGAFDVILDPTRSTDVLATTPSGVLLSTDQGTTFTQLPDAPLLALITPDHTRDGGVLGIDTEEQIWAGSTQAAEAWEVLAKTTGTASAIAHDPEGGLIALADENGISLSEDGGETWHTVIPA